MRVDVVVWIVVSATLIVDEETAANGGHPTVSVTYRRNGKIIRY